MNDALKEKIGSPDLFTGNEVSTGKREDGKSSKIKSRTWRRNRYGENIVPR